MTNSLKRLTAFALVLVLSLGMIPSAFAAEVDAEPVETEPAATETTEATEATEPTAPTEPATTETDGENGEFDPFAPTPEDLARWAELASQLPEPYTGEWPYDPSVKFPYGEPQENYYPSYILNPDPYGISLLADMSQIPAEMYDNSVLRAMSYAGYDVDWLRDNGYLYVAQYVSSNINSTRPAVLSNIGYDDYAPYLNGDETVADSSTVTGRAPDTAAFESSGLVCASYVSYYINNYLPNIEGVDTSHIADAVKATTMNNGSYSTASVWSWSKGLDNLASDPNSGITKYTDEDTAYQNLVPGDVIVFSRDGDLVHVAIYAGTYTFYNASGTNRGEAHFISHVGNSRGPELSTTAYMANAGSKGSTPSAWYHIEYPEADPPGYIEVNKTDPSGKGLGGAMFEAVHQQSGEVFTIGPTNSSGYAISGELPLGTFTVTETVFPSGYQSGGTSQWTVTITKDTPNCTITLDVVNSPKTGGLKLQKRTNTGNNLSGWPIGLYTDAACKVPVDGSPFVTGSDGSITVTNLKPGTYYAKELPNADSYWVCDTAIKTVKVVANQTATVTFSNTHYGRIAVQKHTNTGNHLGGWPFVIRDSNGNIAAELTTDERGYAVTGNLPLGRYTVQEVSTGDDYWQTELGFHNVTVTAGKTVVDEWTNVEQGLGWFHKETNTSASAEGWEITIYTDAACTQEYRTVVTNEEGNVGIYLNPGTYWAKETGDTLGRFDNEYWQIDASIQKFEIKPHEDTSITFRNTHLGKLKIIKAMESEGSPEGWVFKITDANGKEIDGSPFTTSADGTILTGNILPGKYTVEELIPEDSLYYCTSQNPQTITVKEGQTAEVQFVNALRPGKITIQKTDLKEQPLAGAKFLLEWSEDGSLWYPIEYTEGETVVLGGCSNPDVVDGTLTTPKSGVLEWGNLHPALYYRITELEAPEGYILLTEPAYEGKLPVDDLEIVLRVVNCEVFTLPKTGSGTALFFRISSIFCAAVCISMLLLSSRKKRR